ncbi:MAG: hypothetical protein A2X34_06625 [Elusimicrobia bacterium GWC2_51_8]|nr:MAG: hypothetical protein A2X34_06625 [Elusimicrobia bacterium GWC2_51_8]OGR87392.1 MAG: hypothetical protein A2021_02140 [Elusimicrobia bacterium GWF2_52_66]HAF95693.1 hypothetical protein [Elusimicrobiota bacterium]
MMNEKNNIYPLTRQKFPIAEYTIAGTLISLFSIFLGFYASAITFASQSYPELNIGVIIAIHNSIISNLIVTASTAVPLIAGLFYMLARRHAAMMTGGPAPRP